ncbi:uncharacterized protein LOC113300278 isoform X2 [Papaver somniferum]|uniref:uncharacterized protein LOC113300278 isoform X2 n=1 Tax=Papaver somniferum TaxID=3469 RepID=UPI000E6FC4C2|nr:uncharacterized protein LOC113300278 isoform X2 [Papaver somniferum]
METTNFVPPPIDDERSAENRGSMCDLDQKLDQPTEGGRLNNMYREKETEDKLGGVPPLNLENNSDLCEELIKRYGKSGAKRHKRLCASASAMRKVLEKEDGFLVALLYMMSWLRRRHRRAQLEMKDRLIFLVEQADEKLSQLLNPIVQMN